MITEGWADALPGPTTPGDGVNRLSVTFTQEATDAAYGWTDVLTLGKGNSTGPHPIGDPALDAEVIYHEFAHAVLHRVQPDLHIAQNSVFRQAVDEGLAFYLACSISDAIAQTEAPAAAGAWIPYRWGKLARSSVAWANFGYRDLERWDLAPSQEADHDYLTVYGVFPRFANGTTDPDGKGYACGMVWARTLWDIRRILGHPWADAIILRGTQLAGGTQADLETPAEAIIHADAMLAQHHGVPPHENALRVIFSSRGILADSPIHAVKVVQVGQVSAILAATESALATSNDSGCLISLDGGQSWRPLGKAGPQDIVALCTLGKENGDVLVFAAASHGQATGKVLPTAQYTAIACRLPRARWILIRRGTRSPSCAPTEACCQSQPLTPS